MVRCHGTVGNGFGSNLLTIYELAAAIEDAQKFLKEVDGSQENYNSIVKGIEEEIAVTSSRLYIISNITDMTEEDLEQVEAINNIKDYLAYRLEWMLFHGEQMKVGTIPHPNKKGFWV